MASTVKKNINISGHRINCNYTLLIRKVKRNTKTHNRFLLQGCQKVLGVWMRERKARDKKSKIYTCVFVYINSAYPSLTVSNLGYGSPRLMY